jgi:hypothetical protein
MLRRTFLFGACGLVAAPAVIRTAGLLMPIKVQPIIVPVPPHHIGVDHLFNDPSRPLYYCLKRVRGYLTAGSPVIISRAT